MTTAQKIAALRAQFERAADNKNNKELKQLREQIRVLRDQQRIEKFIRR